MKVVAYDDDEEEEDDDVIWNFWREITSRPKSIKIFDYFVNSLSYSSVFALYSQHFPKMNFFIQYIFTEDLLLMLDPGFFDQIVCS